MPLTPGPRLGADEVIDALGAGGMGEVYRARDSKLGRSVAVKIVREGLADPDRVVRFEREAKVLASLNHPHIASLYGMEEADGRHLLVMELVEGETLADRLRRGALPVEDTLRIALQIADALEAAHPRSRRSRPRRACFLPRRQSCNNPSGGEPFQWPLPRYCRLPSRELACGSFELLRLNLWRGFHSHWLMASCSPLRAGIPSRFPRTVDK